MFCNWIRRFGNAPPIHHNVSCFNIRDKNIYCASKRQNLFNPLKYQPKTEVTAAPQVNRLPFFRSQALIRPLGTYKN
jgi:hypothetical protein